MLVPVSCGTHVGATGRMRGIIEYTLRLPLFSSQISAPDGLIPQAPIHTRALIVHGFVPKGEDPSRNSNIDGCLREVQIAWIILPYAESSFTKRARGLVLVHESRRAFKERHRPEGSIYFLTDRALTAPSKPLRHVRKSCILLFVAVQLLAFGMTFMIMQTIAVTSRSRVPRDHPNVDPATNAGGASVILLRRGVANPRSADCISFDHLIVPDLRSPNSHPLSIFARASMMK
ncbi:hypothetical protein B0F90DRAFT_1822886 [Multifurca ochricompacta]|uniref:Uncharacterized protein n=1 Tax=Multifurca ochricompacta TaxID=376703 RepID=A0AAD4QJM7_9AGAM|nr:hypothetical protein B0F90DRAFT_1822886 [Multifurca ochricompacta]